MIGAGERQPDNRELKLTGQNDEACLAVLNNKYRDGIAWHDVACHFRSVIVCEDSDQLIALVQQQNGVDVTNTVKKGEDSRLVDPDAILAEEQRYDLF